MATADVFRARLQTARVLWAALLASDVVFTILGLTLPANAGTPPPTYVPMFWVLALGIAVTSFVLPARQAAALSRATEMEKVPGRPLPGTQLPTVVFADPALAGSRAFAIGSTLLILSMALSEAVCLFGFALHLVGGPTAATLPLSLFGVVLAAVRFPTLERMIGPYARAHGATFETDA
jgi:hypothetical protein